MYYFESNDIFENMIDTKAEHNRSMLLQIRKDNIKRSFCGIETAGHRRQYITSLNGVEYYDDSKAECVNATWFTLDTIAGPIIWIMDGKCNGGDYKELYDKMDNVNAIVCIGDNIKAKSIFGNEIDTIVEAASIEDAVRKASSLASNGSTVILSPSTKTFADDNIGEAYKNEIIQMI